MKGTKKKAAAPLPPVRRRVPPEGSNREALPYPLEEFEYMLSSMGQYPVLSRERTEAIARRYRRFRKRRDFETLVNHNLRFVISIARRYSGRGLAIGDLVQEGAVGLMKAVRKYDPERGFSICTYARWWIHQSIQRALYNTARQVRVPVHVLSVASRISRVLGPLSEELEREPTDEELAEELGGITPSIVKRARALYFGAPHSLDSPMLGDESDTWHAHVADEKAENPAEETFLRERKAILKDVFNGLTLRERAVLERRFGLNGFEPQTLEKVGDFFKVTRERIRQVQDGAIAKLRRSPSLIARLSAAFEGDERAAKALVLPVLPMHSAERILKTLKEISSRVFLGEDRKELCRNAVCYAAVMRFQVSIEKASAFFGLSIAEALACIKAFALPLRVSVVLQRRIDTILVGAECRLKVA
ncbi:MAG: sigma-70 family RNA polymerase sigma factor [Candidatus Taylorbacteria bacterium]|nr:sigma-70 family RNA polymerase sigma factor [Candidatus Taylorbacteria bacterium]